MVGLGAGAAATRALKTTRERVDREMSFIFVEVARKQKRKVSEGGGWLSGEWTKREREREGFYTLEVGSRFGPMS